MRKQRQRAAEYNDRAKPWLVEAGKIEGSDQERNYKFCGNFLSFEDAQKAVQTCQGYHFIDLMYVGPDGKVWDISLTPHMIDA